MTGPCGANGLWLPGKKVRAETGNENICVGFTLESGWGEARRGWDTGIPVVSNPLT